MFIYDLHVHSIGGSACGINSVEEMMKRYKEIGVTGFALTNHFLHGNTGVDRNLPWQEYVKEYARYYYDALDIAQKFDFDLLFGIEECYGGAKEFLVYGIEPELLIANPQLETKDIAVWSEFVRKNGGFIAYAHPFRVRHYIPDPYAMPDLSFVDGIEIYNHENNYEDNERAVTTFKTSGKVFIAGGDKHGTSFSQTYGIMTNRRLRTTQQLADALKNNQFELYLGE